MKIIFLDIDGVLNCDTTVESCGNYLGIDNSKLKLLAEIVDKTKAKVVLTSTWKDKWFRGGGQKYKQDELANYLDTEFFRYGIIVYDKTTDDLFDRGLGIRRWKAEKEVESFVILDDNVFDYKEQMLVSNLILTDGHKGLTEDDVKRAINILMG